MLHFMLCMSVYACCVCVYIMGGCVVCLAYAYMCLYTCVLTNLNMCFTIHVCVAAIQPISKFSGCSPLHLQTHTFRSVC